MFNPPEANEQQIISWIAGHGTQDLINLVVRFIKYGLPLVVLFICSCFVFISPLPPMRSLSFTVFPFLIVFAVSWLKLSFNQPTFDMTSSLIAEQFAFLEDFVTYSRFKSRSIHSKQSQLNLETYEEHHQKATNNLDN